MKGRNILFSFIITALKVIFLLGFLVFIHEGAHFIIARICKVTVNEFSIGFGPLILKKYGKNTKYCLRLIPLGGYVSLEGEEEYSEKEGSFSRASIPKRMAIVLAGGLVNILFAIILYYCLMLSISNHTEFVVDDLVEGYAAQSSQIQKEDRLIKVNNKKIYTMKDLNSILEKSNGEELVLTIQRKNQIIDIPLIPTKNEYKNTGIYLKKSNNNDTIEIMTVEARSVAEKAGIKENDKIIKINDVEVQNQENIIDLIQNSNEKNIKFLLKRGNDEIEIELTPEILANYYLGIYFKKAENSITNNLYYSVFETRDFAFSIIDNLKMLVTGNVRINQFMGPIGITEVVSQTNNIQDFVYILALISLSLGVTNLLPIPALDGGKFLLLLIEAVRKKKIDEKLEMNIQLIGFTILITLSIYIAYYDILRLL